MSTPLAIRLGHFRVQAMIVAGLMASMVRAAGAQTPTPIVEGAPAPSVGPAYPTSPAVGVAPVVAPIGTAAYPGNEASTTTPTVNAAALPAPTASNGMLPASPLPASAQARAQHSTLGTTEAPPVSATHASSDANQNYDWSVGAGIGWTFTSPLTLDVSPNPAGTSGSGYSALGTLGTVGMISSPAPTAITFLERRLANGLFVLAQPEVSYVRYRYPNQEKAIYASSFALGLGLRWIANPNAPVELGMTHSVYIGRASTGVYYTGSLSAGGTTTTALSWATPSTTSVGTASAFVAERMLLPQLWLRVAATFLRMGWSKSEAHFELEDGSTYGGESRKSFSARFGFDPSLSLRLTF